MTQGVGEEYRARHEENLRFLRYARTVEGRRAVVDLIEEDVAAHFRLSDEDRQTLREEIVIQQSWMLTWGWPLIVLSLVLPTVFAVVFSRLRRDLGGVSHWLVAGVTSTLPRWGISRHRGGHHDDNT